MPWCPQCGCEYDEGIKSCYDCRCALVDEWKPPDEGQHAGEAFLMNVADEMEYRIVESKLNQFGIPAYKRYREAGDYTFVCMGRTFGLDVFVPDTALALAKKLVTEKADRDQEAEAVDAEEAEADAMLMRNRTLRAWGKKILLTYLILNLIILGVMALGYLVSFFLFPFR